MKILFVINEMKIGGIETLLIRTVRELLRQGHEPVVLSMARSGNLLTQLETTGVRVRSITDNVKDLGFFKPKVMRRLRCVVKEEEPNILHLCDVISGHIGRLACLSLGVPVMYHLHSLIPHSKAKYRFVDGLLSFATDKYISVAKAVETLRVHPYNWARRRHEILYNAIDTGELKGAVAADLSDLLPTPGSVLLTVGRLVSLKNIDLVIQALSRLKQSFPATYLLIVGDGPERKSLEQMAHEMGVTESVIFAGFRDDVPSILKALEKQQSVFIMPSDYEGFGLAPLEGFFFGIPAIMSPHVPLLEIAERASLICTTEAEDIAEKLTTLLSDPVLYRQMANAARAIAPRYSMEQYVEKLLRIYNTELI